MWRDLIARSLVVAVVEAVHERARFFRSKNRITFGTASVESAPIDDVRSPAEIEAAAAVFTSSVL